MSLDLLPGYDGLPTLAVKRDEGGNHETSSSSCVVGRCGGRAIGLSGIAAAVSPTPDASGIEHIIVLRTSLASNPTIIARGPVHARGKDVIVSNNLERFVFPDGVLVVRHHPTKHHDAFDKVTCYGRHTESGPYTVVRGTKSYAHASGHGTYRLKVQAVGCSQSKPPRPFLLEANLAGVLRL